MFWGRLTKEIWKTIHGKKTIRELSEVTGISENTLYRSALAYSETPSAISPSLKTVILVMKATRDFRVLKFIANYFGFLLVRLPRVGRNKKSNIEKIRELQEHHMVAVQFLIEYDRHPSRELRNNCIKALYICIEYQTGIIRDLKHNFHQLEFAF